jgi:hypothetical protein
MRRGPRVEPITFAALNIGAGKVVGQLHRRHRCNEFLSFRRIIEEAGLIKPDVHLVMDNYPLQSRLAGSPPARQSAAALTAALQQAIRSYLQIYKRDPRSIRPSTASNDSACELLTQDTRPLALVMLSNGTNMPLTATPHHGHDAGAEQGSSE